MNPGLCPAAQTLTRKFAKKRILVVEDDLYQSEMMEYILEAAGLQVTLADNGETAVARFTEQTFDLILMDIRMPRMDGLQASRIIRKLPNGDVPIIAVTANGITKDSMSYRQSTLDDLLSKPVEPSDLYQTVLHHLDNSPELNQQKSSMDTKPLESECLDVIKGLARCRNNPVKYKGFLLALLHDPAYALTNLGELINTHPKEAIHRCHTTKGLAATLGAMRYHKTLETLENGLEEGTSPDELEKMLADVEAAQRSLNQKVTELPST